MNALTFDIEEYYHVHAFASVIDPVRWNEYPARVEIGTRRILEALGTVRATFFILGHVAERQPKLVNEIAAAGHEIASHGFYHQRVDALSADEFRIDVRQSKQLLEQMTGCRVTAYRAPSFSITSATPWAHEILIDEGYTVDSSIAAGRRGRSLEPLMSGPHIIQTRSGSLTEIPLPAVARIPVGGGGYLRLFPYWLTKRLLQQLTQPFCVYLHPWEFDAEQPRLVAPWRQNIRHRIGLNSTEPKLRELLQDFAFGAVGSVLQSILPIRVAA